MIYELSQEQLRLLIVKLLPKTLVANEGNASGFSEELDSRARHVWLDCFLNACSYLVSDMPMAFSLTIMSPTALAMLNPDNPASVTVFPEQNYSGSGPVVSKIALPRCSTLQAMHKLLHALLQN